MCKELGVLAVSFKDFSSCLLAAATAFSVIFLSRGGASFKAGSDCKPTIRSRFRIVRNGTLKEKL